MINASHFEREISLMLFSIILSYKFYLILSFNYDLGFDTDKMVYSDIFYKHIHVNYLQKAQYFLLLCKDRHESAQIIMNLSKSF